jgi:hypothetical protein
LAEAEGFLGLFYEGTPLFNQNTAQTLSGSISGGALAKDGTGALTLSSANTYTASRNFLPIWAVINSAISIERRHNSVNYFGFWYIPAASL